MLRLQLSLLWLLLILKVQHFFWLIIIQSHNLWCLRLVCYGRLFILVVGNSVLVLWHFLIWSKFSKHLLLWISSLSILRTASFSSRHTRPTMWLSACGLFIFLDRICFNLLMDHLLIQLSNIWIFKFLNFILLSNHVLFFWWHLSLHLKLWILLILKIT